MASIDASEVASWLTIAGVTVLVVVALILGVSLLLLFRRRQGAQPSSASGLDELRTRANILLVRADEAVDSGSSELGFAIAQFGEQRTADFAAAVAEAKSDLAEAFRLQQALDDAVPESASRRREWALQITALCENAIARLSSQDRSFAELRGREADSPARIADLRRRVAGLRSRLEPAQATLDRMRANYVTHLIGREERAVAEAVDALAVAESVIADAESRVSPGGASAVEEALHSAERAIARAAGRLDAVDERAEHLATAASALDALLDSSQRDLAEARRERDSASDPDAAAAILGAIARVDDSRAAAQHAARRDPVAAIDALSAAVAELDTALASARNQAQRLEHARTALVGTLASAESQIVVLRDVLASEGRRVGLDARTRLAEAERQLALARITADPMEALSAARRAVTLARDGEALAHYDTMTHGR
jgi:chromosome segregation ATPase